MHLVDDVNLEARAGWRNVYAVAQVANILDAIVTGGVNFDDIKVLGLVGIRQLINLVGNNACN